MTRSMISIRNLFQNSFRLCFKNGKKAAWSSPRVTQIAKTTNPRKSNYYWTTPVFFTIIIRNRKIVGKHGSYCWYFCLNLKFLGWPSRKYIKIVKVSACSVNFHCRYDFDCHFLFLSLWCKRFWASWEGRYRLKRLSQMLLVRYSLHSYNI